MENAKSLPIFPKWFSMQVYGYMLFLPIFVLEVMYIRCVVEKPNKKHNNFKYPRHHPNKQNLFLSTPKYPKSSKQ